MWWRPGRSQGEGIERRGRAGVDVGIIGCGVGRDGGEADSGRGGQLRGVLGSRGAE